jgi:L-ascorbate metabolism protein UlaG (beta-lactamase superfamily)
MTATQAVELLRILQPRVAVPVHYEGWAHFRQGRAVVESALAGAPDVAGRVRWLPFGAPVEVEV